MQQFSKVVDEANLFLHSVWNACCVNVLHWLPSSDRRWTVTDKVELVLELTNSFALNIPLGKFSVRHAKVHEAEWIQERCFAIRDFLLKVLLNDWSGAKFVKLVSWSFESGQPQRIISGLKTNFTLWPTYPAYIVPSIILPLLKQQQQQNNRQG